MNRATAHATRAAAPRSAATAVQARRMRSGDPWHTVELVPTSPSADREVWAGELAAALARARQRFPSSHYEHRTITKNPDQHHHIPPTTVRLGQVLDLVTQLGPVRTTWDVELAGWHMLADIDAMQRSAGTARLYLVRGELIEQTEAPPPEHAGATYEQWHDRAPHLIGELAELPDFIGTYLGRALRIGYRSDKWHEEGKGEDYDHDFTERRHTPPEAWSDTAELDKARAIVIVGGDMRITPEGIN